MAVDLLLLFLFPTTPTQSLAEHSNYSATPVDISNRLSDPSTIADIQAGMSELLDYILENEDAFRRYSTSLNPPSNASTKQTNLT